jgi:hypothetical protein
VRYKAFSEITNFFPSRLLSAGDSLFKTPPTEEEKTLIHDFFIKTVEDKFNFKQLS